MRLMLQNYIISPPFCFPKIMSRACGTHNLKGRLEGFGFSWLVKKGNKLRKNPQNKILNHLRLHFLHQLRAPRRLVLSSVHTV